MNERLDPSQPIPSEVTPNWSALWKKLEQRSIDFNVFFGCVSRKIMYSQEKKRFTSTLPGNAKGARYLEYFPDTDTCIIENEAKTRVTLSYEELVAEDAAGWPHLLGYLHGSKSFEAVKEGLISSRAT